ncbi:MAG: hypothetical protein GX267_00245 [Fibrobacter sp.]|jgi:hypothetical protein|nr:hypothetical protein [Fibrobacter sp.]
MSSEDLFYKELASCPGLPQGQFDIIRKKIRRKTVIKRFSISGTLTAVLISAFLITQSLWRVNTSSPQPELVAEIQIIQEYLNGEDLEEQIQMYAFFDEQ